MIWQITSGVNVAGAPQRARRSDAPPVTGRLAPNPQLLCRLVDAKAG